MVNHRRFGRRIRCVAPYYFLGHFFCNSRTITIRSDSKQKYIVASFNINEKRTRTYKNRAFRFEFAFLKSGSTTRTEGNIAVLASHSEDTVMIHSHQAKVETRNS